MGNEAARSKTHQFLLRSPDKIKLRLSLADKYMQTYAEDPNTFLLPKAHESLKPLIQAYANDLEGFTHFVAELRNAFSRDSVPFKDIQAIYRRINGRYVQQQRRERMRRAVRKAEELYGEIPYTKRMQWMAALEHDWARRRLAFLEAQRTRLKAERLSTDQRTELLLEFWETIDTEIYEGRLPTWT